MAEENKEKAVLAAVLAAYETSSQIPTHEEIWAKASTLAPIIGYSGDLQNVVATAESEIPSHMSAGISLVNVEADHDQDWIHKREFDSIYADAYGEHLKREAWKPSVVNTLLENDGSKILGLLQDPKSEGTWSRRGLVIGHVQSGKTANYVGVIAKAADAGYKFIIVIAGIHNNLRKQTQQRIDEGFVGRSSDPRNRGNIGVGFNKDYPHPVTLTSVNSDFNKKTGEQSGHELNDFKKPVIIVIKKNVKTLEGLYSWLHELNTKGHDRIADVPLLVIDDEADNASINTNKPDIDPTKTNAWIRKILRLFAKSCYVGYTATPFANIFIDPDSFAGDVYEELFPKDFIYSMDAPTTYFGPEKVFINEDISDKILVEITDGEEYIPLSHKKDTEFHELPPSLYGAIDTFIVARAIRNLRKQERKHCSMLINVSRFVSIQRDVEAFVNLRLDKIREAVKANYLMPDKSSELNEYMANIKAVFENEYANCEFAWPEVKRILWSVFDNLKVYLINGKSDDVLDYGKYQRDGNGLTAIAIGGLSLSRGLTIEGLTVSYMYRNTKMYDTLMQMARWFGYRPGYEDLCRVFLSEDSISWYKHIAEATEELRQQIRNMRIANLSPREFGLYVTSHPDSLLITAANKMRSAEKITISQNFTGKLIESFLLDPDKETCETNEILITEFWRDKFGGEISQTEKGWYVRDVDTMRIIEFLTRFKSHYDASNQKKAATDYLRAIYDDFPKGDVILISKGPSEPGEFRLGPQLRTAAEATTARWQISGYRVASRGDEKLGLTPVQIDEANKIANEANSTKTVIPSDYHYRLVRNKPLLMIHILQPKDNVIPICDRVPAWGISFPDGLYKIAINVVANKVWLEKEYGPFGSDAEPEEDFDDE